MNSSVLGSQSAMPGTALPSATSLLVKVRNATAFFSAAGPFIGLPVVRDFALRVQIPLLWWQAWHRPHTTPLKYAHSILRFLQWSQVYGFGSVSGDGFARADTHRLRLRRWIHLLAFALAIRRASLAFTSLLPRQPSSPSPSLSAALSGEVSVAVSPVLKPVLHPHRFLQPPPGT